MSERSQSFIVWWALVLTTVYCFAFGFLLHMVGPPSATLTVGEVAAWYAERRESILVGAVLCSWSGMFIAPLWCVIAAQIWRQEKGRVPIWTIMAAVNGMAMGLFLTFPPIIWGVAAFRPNPNPDVLATLHDLGMLTFISTDQVYVFNFVAVSVISLMPQAAPYSPFPRWYGYFSAFCTVLFEVGAFAYLFKSGPLAWNGLIVYWLVVTCFIVWIGVTATLLLTALKKQRLAVPAEQVPVPVPA